MNLWDVTDHDGDRFVINVDTICDIYEDSDSLWRSIIGLMNGDAIVLDMNINKVLETLRGMMNKHYER